MPEAAFSDLWQHMKANKHWMGIVKNRTKNGDYYWVDAYVTPIFENGYVTAYESVRVKPSAERVSRAEKIYQQLSAGKAPKLGNFVSRLSLNSRTILVNLIAICVGIAAFSINPGNISGFIAIAVSMGLFI